MRAGSRAHTKKEELFEAARSPQTLILDPNVSFINFWNERCSGLVNLIEHGILEKAYPAGPSLAVTATFYCFCGGPTFLPVSMPGHNERESEHEQVPISQLKQKV